jgi:hypothetical protein
VSTSLETTEESSPRSSSGTSPLACFRTFWAWWRHWLLLRRCGVWHEHLSEMN